MPWPASHARTAKVAEHPWAWPLTVALITLLSLGLRLHYVIHAQVLQPVYDQQHVRADGVEYYAYARNLVQHRTFSMAPESGAPPAADSFRDPGYPVFLAAWMAIWPDWDPWYAAVLLSQAVLGGLTVPLGMMLARRWMPLPWLAAAGTLMALWPHSIAINSFILSESLVGFLTVAGLVWLGRPLDAGRRTAAMGGTAVLAMAGLSNAVLIPAAAIAALWLTACRRINRRTALALLVFPFLLCGTWQARNALLVTPSSTTGRALINLDQGSWPEYHWAYQGAMQRAPDSIEAMQAIDEETALVQRDPVRGLRTILGRFGEHPLHYAAWYLSKPALLWGWNIRMGQGDIYVYPTRASPFVDNGILRAVAAVCRALNPLLLVAMAASWILIVWRRQHVLPSLHLTAAIAVYVTFVYSALQAEPRYAIPFRPLEILLATWTTWLMTLAAKARLGRSRAPA